MKNNCSGKIGIKMIKIEFESKSLKEFESKKIKIEKFVFDFESKLLIQSNRNLSSNRTYILIFSPDCYFINPNTHNDCNCL